ncbi:MAG: PQQ-binding-like beta-propeller repeat protein [Actinomycetota bacterium]|nr:PQQ-binding-like beta-propeller repeat protein [Actinomycetota bacterium]
MSRGLRRTALSLILAVVLVGCGSSVRTRSTSPSTGATPTTTTTPGPLGPLWTAPLDGAAVYATPVMALGRVFVVTEADDVYALDAHDGHVLWRANIGSPLANVAARAGCGSIDPLGITSRPVLDPATSTLYAVGEVSSGGSSPIVHRQLVGLDASTGKVVRSANADPTGGGDDSVDLQQRADLALAGGRVYVGFGGLFGDCGTYHGWVVGVSEQAGPGNVEFNVTPGNEGGAVWEPGGPSIDPAGNVFITTGNRNNPDDPNVRYAESVVKLSPTLIEEASFTDPVATGDGDLGTDSPTLLPNGTLFAVGKTNVGYVLRQSDLGLVARIPGVCGSDPVGSNAFDAATDTVYVPCRAGGIQEVDLAHNRLGWRHGEVNATPVLAVGSLWALHYPNGTLQALDPATGAVRRTAPVGAVPTFATPFVADGLVLVGTTSGVKAFSG